MAAQEDDGVSEYLYKILVVGDIGTGKTSIIKRFVHGIFSMHYKSTIGVDFALKVINWDPKTEVRLQLWDIAGQERFGNMTRVYYKEAVGAMIVFDVTRVSTFEAVAKWKADIDAKVTYGPDEKPIPVVLLANKCDLAKEGFVKTANEMDKYVKENGFLNWTSSFCEGRGVAKLLDMDPAYTIAPWGIGMRGVTECVQGGSFWSHRVAFVFCMSANKNIRFETSAKDNINIDKAAKCLVAHILENDIRRKAPETNTVSPNSAKPQEEGGFGCCK